MSFVAKCLKTDSGGHLCIEQVDTTELAREYGTPLYVMSETQIRESCKQYVRSLQTYYGGNGLVLYASKAFCCKEICRIAQSEGLGLDVVSGGELYTAKSVGFPPENIYFHGNNKTEKELIEALDYGVGFIVVDNLDELQTLAQIAKEQGKTQPVLLRVKPGVDAHTHEYIRTGQIDSKFGFALETGEAMQAAQAAVQLDEVELVGLHCHIGSQIFETEPFVLAARIMLGLMAQIRKNLGTELRVLNLGGGYGISYLPGDRAPGYETYMKEVSKTVRETCDLLHFPVPQILLEPGRSIVGPAGITLYTVGSVKTIPAVRTYVSVDGGMTDNPRYALYGSEYEIVNAQNASGEKTMQITLAGRCCESGDLIGENMPVQPLQKGDVLAVLATGAYNYSMASHYNRVPKPGVVMVKENTHRLIVQAESWEDMARMDL